ncbi:11607_t:CDS:1, partial [Dentiscutata heterogama]
KPIKDITLDPLIALLVEKAQRGEMKEKKVIKLVKDLGKNMKESIQTFTFDRAAAFPDALIDLKKGKFDNHILLLINKFLAPKLKRGRTKKNNPNYTVKSDQLISFLNVLLD